MKFLYNFFSLQRVKCPDGTERFIHRDIDKLFPLTVSDMASKFNGDLKVSETVDAKIAADISQVIKSLLVSIDSTNGSFIMEQRGVYAVYASNPCEGHDRYSQQMEDISERRQLIQEKQMLLETLITIAQSPNTNTNDIIKVLGRLVDILPPKYAAIVAVAEMDNSEKIADEMIRGEKNNG